MPRIFLRDWSFKIWFANTSFSLLKEIVFIQPVIRTASNFPWRGVGRGRKRNVSIRTSVANGTGLARKKCRFDWKFVVSPRAAAWRHIPVDTASNRYTWRTEKMVLDSRTWVYCQHKMHTFTSGVFWCNTSEFLPAAGKLCWWPARGEPPIHLSF